MVRCHRMQPRHGADGAGAIPRPGNRKREASGPILRDTGDSFSGARARYWYRGSPYHARTVRPRGFRARWLAPAPSALDAASRTNEHAASPSSRTVDAAATTRISDAGDFE